MLHTNIGFLIVVVQKSAGPSLNRNYKFEAQKKKTERNVYAYDERFKMTGSDTKMTFEIIASYILTVFVVVSFLHNFFYFHHRMDWVFRIRMNINKTTG